MTKKIEFHIPVAEESEVTLLGCLINHPEKIEYVKEHLSEKDFCGQRNRILYKILLEMDDNNTDIDVITVADSLKSKNMWDEVGSDYFENIIMEACMNTMLSGYVDTVKQTSILRKIKTVAYKILKLSEGDYGDIYDLNEQFVKKLLAISTENDRTEMCDAKTSIKEALEDIRLKVECKDNPDGIMTGIEKLDDCTGGFKKGDVIIIAARPSMGKTAFAMNIVLNTVLTGRKVAVFSLEMSRNQLMLRLISQKSRVNLQNIFNGDLTAKEWADISNASAMIYNSALFINDSGGISVRNIRSQVRRMAGCDGIDLIVIDYLQLIGSDGKRENRQAEISDISRDLKNLAKEMNCPVICLSQLNRAADSRADHHPNLSDLRDSGAIEQDADVVLMLYREYYYYPDEDETANDGEVIIAKHRNGPVGAVKVRWDGEYCAFSNPA